MTTTTLHIPHKRLRLFRLIALALPLVLILALEGVLRLAHYGYDPSVFIPAPGNKTDLVFNPDASKIYFTDPLIATTGNREPFHRIKEPGTLRIFVLGESTTIGYPYFHNGSFHRWLQYRLMRENPGKKIEIINLSLTAVNSYTVLGFTREVIRQQPDAVLIYAGHNEYYGALGVASTDRLGNSPWLINTLLWLRQWRLVQLLTRAWHGLSRLFTSGPPTAGRTRMELMVADQRIAYGSDLYTRGIKQFSTNMDKTLALFHQAGIPVFLSNLVSNLRDQPPLVSITGPGSPDSASAGYHYNLATSAWQRGDYTTAKQEFILAKDRDALRFRAPEALNTAIAALCEKYSGNTHLVDTQAAFDSASDHGIIGSRLLLEHVHPNLYGYALMSDVFYQALRRSGIIPAPAAASPADPATASPADPATASPTDPAPASPASPATTGLSLPQLLAEMPITRVDSLSGAFRIDNLKNNWPFNPTGRDGGPPSRQSYHLTTEESDLAYALTFEHLPWEEAMRQLYDYYSKTEDWSRAATVMEALCLEHPTDAALFERTAMVYGKAGEKEKAITWFRDAFDREPSFERARYLFRPLPADRSARRGRSLSRLCHRQQQRRHAAATHPRGHPRYHRPRNPADPRSRQSCPPGFHRRHLRPDG
jgi:lysophospholipase L1-like esterase